MSVWGPATPTGQAASSTGQDAPDAPPEAVFADLFDGSRAMRRRVELRAGQGGLDLLEPDDTRHHWPAGQIHRVPDQAGGRVTVFARDGADPARLVVADGPARLLVERVATRPARAPAGPALKRRAALVVAGGAGFIAALVFAVLPLLAAGLARVMSPEAEAAMGEMQYEQTRVFFGGERGALRECDDPAGLAALQAMTDRVAAGVDLPYPLQVAVLDDRAEPILNAYAVAGGRVAFFDAMIQAAEHPDEIAAVLAHELGHVVNDDPVRGMLQQLSGVAILSLLLGDVTGGGLLSSTATGALSASYSRGAEAEADEFAAAQLRAQGLPPSALGRMFERLRDRYGDATGIVRHFSSHPQLAARIAAAERAGDPDGAPALDPAQWAALRGICR
ncbi:M48 family metallopeptidase [Jannaschia ovalis]|uniref:M48 family metallopeptidase n=1 Tax=Jannaschia ovalis TaxID=3038773 RepID=A0ABY8LFR8_9RHOB|nr:M48 family metallopeptidase [Jannaschia sp. GRR-S6-38]WGH79185.1 M48 family metallopeptidase [Jannaschia sp. GRR-S6-38]